MDGLKSSREAMAIMDEACDILTITTLKGSVSPTSSNSSGQIVTSEEERGCFTSSNSASKTVKKTSQRMVNSCSQTDDERLLRMNSHGATEEFVDKRYMSSAFGVNERAVYKVSKSAVDKQTNSGAWEMIREKIDIVRGRRHSKERNRESTDEKKHHRNSSPNSFEQERDDAIAELDSVIESYHGKTSGSVLKRSRRRGKELEKNGGTWPKARNGPVIEHGTGTILHPRKHKERLPLSELLNNPPKYPPDTLHYCSSGGAEQPSRPISMAHDRAVSCSAAYKAQDTNTVLHFNKSGGLLCTQKSFTPTPFKELMRENKSSTEFERDRLSVLAPSDASIDFSVKSGNIGKEVLEYYAKKKSSKYPPSDSESNISPVESLPSHSRIHSQLYGVPATVHPSLVRSLPHYPFTPFHLAHPHPHPHSDSVTTSLPARYPSPPHLPSSQSGESIGLPDSRSYCFEPPYSPTPQVRSTVMIRSMKFKVIKPGCNEIGYICIC